MPDPDYTAPVSYDDLAAVVEPDAERAALVAWIREQHAEAVRGWRDGRLDLGVAVAYTRVLERLGEKP